MPVVTEDESGRKAEIMKWGLIPVWAKDPNIGYKMINARAESIFEKPAWRNVIKRKRCLIPADGFYEWNKIIGDNKKPQKVPYYIHPKDEDLFAFAGVWETWKDVEGIEWHTYSIITTEANKDMRWLHDRMPVILHQEDESSWLAPSHNDDRGAIEALLRPYEDGGLDMFEVSSDVNVTKNDDAKLIYPINSQ
jgi:putative SOS response-associated peptidase YedK